MKNTKQEREYWIKKTIWLAKKSLPKDIPVGALLINRKNQKLVSCGFNLREKHQQISAHAELIAVSRACKKLGTYNLKDLILYSSLEPCIMCMGAIVQSKIPEVVFSAYQREEVFKTYKKNQIKLIGGILEEDSKNLIQEFFRKKRNKIINNS